MQLSTMGGGQIEENDVADAHSLNVALHKLETDECPEHLFELGFPRDIMSRQRLVVQLRTLCPVFREGQYTRDQFVDELMKIMEGSPYSSQCLIAMAGWIWQQA